jgi:hypothetical protein
MTATKRSLSFALASICVVCFHLNEVQAKAFRKSQLQLLQATTVADLNDIIDNNNNNNMDVTKAVLHFEGAFTHDSDPLPNTSPRQIMDFFHDSEHRSLLLKGGDNPHKSISPTRELLEQWRSQAAIVNSISPTDDDPILAISSTVSLLPGLSIQAVSVLGCKFLQNPTTLLPIYEFTLIKDDYNAEGARFMVWLFNQVTGNSNKDKANACRKTHALSRISMEHTLNGMVMKYSGMVKVSCKIPRRLLSVLPLSKKKAESKVSKAIVKQLEKEGLRSIQKFQTALKEWLERDVSSSSETPFVRTLFGIDPRSMFPRPAWHP